MNSGPTSTRPSSSANSTDRNRRCTGVHLKGHAQRPSHKGYLRYKAFRDLIKEGSSRHAQYTFCYRDISKQWEFLRQDEIIRTQKASLSRDEFARQMLGLWTRDG